MFPHNHHKIFHVLNHSGCCKLLCKEINNFPKADVNQKSLKSQYCTFWYLGQMDDNNFKRFSRLYGLDIEKFLMSYYT